MTLDEAKQKKKELQEELKELSNFISDKERRDKLYYLEEGKYYNYKDSKCVNTYFQYTNKCNYKENEICGPTLSLDKYISEERTMMYYNLSFGNNGIIFLSDHGCFKEINEKEFNEVCKRVIRDCENMIIKN